MCSSKNKGKKSVENNVKPTADNRKLEPFKRIAQGHKKPEDFLGQAEGLFRTIAENSNNIIMIADAQGKVLYINNTGSKLRERTPLGNNAFDLLDPESRNLCKQAMEESLTTNKSVIIEQSGPNSTWWLVQFIPIKKFQGLAPITVIICTDITEHKKMEDELERVNRALSVIGKCNEILVRSSDEKHFLNDICRAIVEVEGYCLVWVGLAEKDEEMTVRPVAHTGFEDGYLDTVNITWADTERGRGPTGTAIRTGKPQIMRDILRDPNYAPWRNQALKHGYASSVALPMISEGQTIGALNVYSDQLDAFNSKEVELLMELAGDLAYGIKSLRNRAERDRLNKELLNHRNKLRSLTMELALAEEYERHRIATGIHDEIGQKLAMAKLELQKLEHQGVVHDISTDLSHVCDRIDEMLKDTRSLTFELSNPLLYTTGLGAAVESWLEQRIRIKDGINCEFISNLRALCLDTEVRITLFQAIRELLTNVIKHAKAGNVKVRMLEINDRVEIVIEDDGIGFKVAEILESSAFSPTGHFGVFNVRERIEQLGGRFDVVSAPKQGTQITITVAKKYSTPRLNSTP